MLAMTNAQREPDEIPLLDGPPDWMQAAADEAGLPLTTWLDQIKVKDQNGNP